MRSETELIELAQSGDREAFDELVKQCEDKIFNLSFKLTGNTANASDLWQEAFINAYKNITKFKFKCSFSGWMYRITVNLWKNKLKHDKRHGFLRYFSIDEPVKTGDDEVIKSIADTLPGPGIDFEIKQRDEKILKSLDELNPESRMIVVLCILENKTYKETSEIVGCSLRSVKAKLSRARELLRQKLSVHFEGKKE